MHSLTHFFLILFTEIVFHQRNSCVTISFLCRFYLRQKRSALKSNCSRGRTAGRKRNKIISSCDMTVKQTCRSSSSRQSSTRLLQISLLFVTLHPLSFDTILSCVPGVTKIRMRMSLGMQIF